MLVWHSRLARGRAPTQLCRHHASSLRLLWEDAATHTSWWVAKVPGVPMSELKRLKSARNELRTRNRKLRDRVAELEKVGDELRVENNELHDRIHAMIGLNADVARLQKFADGMLELSPHHEHAGVQELAVECGVIKDCDIGGDAVIAMAGEPYQEGECAGCKDLKAEVKRLNEMVTSMDESVEHFIQKRNAAEAEVQRLRGLLAEAELIRHMHNDG